MQKVPPPATLLLKPKFQYQLEIQASPRGPIAQPTDLLIARTEVGAKTACEVKLMDGRTAACQKNCRSPMCPGSSSTTAFFSKTCPKKMKKEKKKERVMMMPEEDGRP